MDGQDLRALVSTKVDRMDLLDASLSELGLSWERLSFEARAATRHIDNPARVANGQTFWVLGYVSAVARFRGGIVVG